MSTDAPALAPEIVAALVAEEGSRERAAVRLGLPRTTFFRRIRGHGATLRALGASLGWPTSTAAATRAAASPEACEKRNRTHAARRSSGSA